MANPFETDWDEPELDTLSSLAQHLVYRLRGCDDNTIRLTLREVYRDFCRRSCCLRVRRLFEHVPGGMYFVPTMFGGHVGRVTEVRDGDWRLKEGRDYVVDGNCVNVRRVSCRPIGVVEKPRKIAISWIEVPALSSEKIPRWLIEKHGDSICSGVMAKLCIVANRPWSDPQLAMAESGKYEAAVNEECQRLYAVNDGGSLGSLFDTSDMI